MWMLWVQVCRERFCEVSGFEIQHVEFRDSWKSYVSETCAVMSPRKLFESIFSRRWTCREEVFFFFFFFFFFFLTPMYVIYEITKAQSETKSCTDREAEEYIDCGGSGRRWTGALRFDAPKPAA